LGNLVKADAESGNFCTLMYTLWRLGVGRSPCYQSGSVSVILLIQNSTICVCHTDSRHHAYDSLLTANQTAKKHPKRRKAVMSGMCLINNGLIILK